MIRGLLALASAAIGMSVAGFVGYVVGLDEGWRAGEEWRSRERQ